MDKILSLVGIATRAGKTVSGTGACELALKNGQAKLVLISQDAGKNTVKHFTDMAPYRDTPVFALSDNGELGSKIGHPERKTSCITDIGFAQAVKKQINLNLEVK